MRRGASVALQPLSVPRAILASAYFLLLVFGVAAFIGRGLSVVQIVLLFFIAITLFAIVGKGGHAARVIGCLLGLLYAAVGLFLFGAALMFWADSPNNMRNVLVGAVLAVLGVGTVWTLWSDIQSSRTEDQPED